MATNSKYIFKGNVNSVSDLPQLAEDKSMYYVLSQRTYYAFNGIDKVWVTANTIPTWKNEATAVLDVSGSALTVNNEYADASGDAAKLGGYDASHYSIVGHTHVKKDITNWAHTHAVNLSDGTNSGSARTDIETITIKGTSPIATNFVNSTNTMTIDISLIGSNGISVNDGDISIVYGGNGSANTPSRSDHTHTGNEITTKVASASNADTLNNHSADTNATANTIMLRDANGNVSINTITGSATNALALKGMAPDTTDTPNTIVQRDTNGNFSANVITATISGSTDSLTTARNISLEGDVTGNTSFNGTADATITATVNDSAKLGGQLPSSYEQVANKGVANGYASLDANTKVPIGQIPTTFISNIDMGGHLIKNVIAPVDPHDVANKDYVDAYMHGLEWQDSVKSLSLATPPASPVKGDRYIVAPSATGNWSGHDNEITQYDGSTWQFITIDAGMATWVEDADVDYVYNGTTWIKFGSTINHNNTTGLQGGSATERYHLTEAEYNDVVNATNTNTPSTVVKRDANGNFSAGTITAQLNGNADTSSKLQNAFTLTIAGTASGSATVDGSANVQIDTTISDTKLSGALNNFDNSGNLTATAPNADKLNGMSADTKNTPSTIVQRDANGDFSAGTITATLNGTANNANTLQTHPASDFVLKSGDTMSGDLNVNSHSLTNVQEIDMTSTGVLKHGTSTVIDANGKVWGAVYNDIAEAFIAGEPLEAGDVVSYGPDDKVYKCRNFDTAVVGIVTENPSIIMGTTKEEYENNPNIVLVAMAGRVPVKIELHSGRFVKTGTLLSAGHNGMARIGSSMGSTIGKVLKRIDNDHVLAMVMLA